ncbi:MAG TPA: hypothetical protein VKS03_09665 [Thermoanaerobaculia bacterium]|nr:hypothetical protein [Thermoanaerobaculia bacterium]
MRIRRRIVAAGFAALLGFVPAAPAQWMRLQRCSGALPCAIPFGVRYAPDPLIASQYGRMSPDALSGRIALDPNLSVEVDLPRLSLEPADFAARAAREFVLAHPGPSPKAPALE